MITLYPDAADENNKFASEQRVAIQKTSIITLNHKVNQQLRQLKKAKGLFPLK